MLKIRKVKISDWDDLKKLIEDLTNERPPVALELHALLQKGEDWIRQFPKGDLGYFVVAERNKKIIAFCYLAVPQYYKPIAYIGIAVSKKHRKEDLGSMLFYEVASWAAMERLQFIIADIWSWNSASLKFFKNLGFEEKSRFEDKFQGEIKQKLRLVRKL
jgi:RimJ/RimL family protein N-acetyltransferase